MESLRRTFRGLQKHLQPSLLLRCCVQSKTVHTDFRHMPMPGVIEECFDLQYCFEH